MIDKFFRTVVQLGAVAVLSRGGIVFAQEDHDSIGLHSTACEESTMATVRSLIALELLPRAVLLDPDDDADLNTTARLHCYPDAVMITVYDGNRAEPLTLELDLRATAHAARERLIALTVSELIVTSRMEPRPIERPSSGSPSSSAPRESDEIHATPWAAAGITRLGEPATLGPTVQVGALGRRGSLGALADVRVDWASVRLTEGEATMWTLAGSVAPAVVWHTNRFDVFAGVGVCAGYARLRGLPSSPELEGNGLGGAWIAAMLTTGVHTRVAEWALLRGAFETGYVIRPVRGLDVDQQQSFALEGLRLALTVGVGFE